MVKRIHISSFKIVLLWKRYRLRYSNSTTFLRSVRPADLIAASKMRNCFVLISIIKLVNSNNHANCKSLTILKEFFERYHFRDVSQIIFTDKVKICWHQIHKLQLRMKAKLRAIRAKIAIITQAWDNLQFKLIMQSG